jgi:hypothetical protein
MSTNDININSKKIYFGLASSLALICDAVAKEENAVVIANQRIVDETLSLSRSDQNIAALRGTLAVLGNISGEVTRVIRDAIVKEENLIRNTKQKIEKEKKLVFVVVKPS